MTDTPTLINPGSSALKADLDWSQVQETISMLCLAMAQIQTAMSDSSESVNSVTHSFVQIAEDSQALVNICDSLDSGDDLDAAKAQIRALTASLTGQVSHAAVSFQFYDRVCQKLGHVNESLSHLGELINDRSRLFSPDEWLRIQNEIKSNYTMDCERLMFDLIMSGAPLNEALNRYHQEYDRMHKKSDDACDGVEMF
ncbi:MAG: hypothetical protein V7752_19885 [Halopseudomonas sp.]